MSLTVMKEMHCSINFIFIFNNTLNDLQIPTIN